MGTKIKDVELVYELTGEEKIPVSNGSDQPAAISVNQVEDKILNKLPRMLVIDFNDSDHEPAYYQEIYSIIDQYFTKGNANELVIMGYESNSGDVDTAVCQVSYNLFENSEYYITYSRQHLFNGMGDPSGYTKVRTYQLSPDGTLAYLGSRSCTCAYMKEKYDYLPLSTPLENVIDAYNNLLELLESVDLLAISEDSVRERLDREEEEEEEE